MGLYDLKARFYDAKIARFMQEDTYLGESSDPLSLNLYTYCSNNPITYYDPSGHASEFVFTRNDGSTWSTFAGGYVDKNGNVISTTPEYTSGGSTNSTSSSGSSSSGSTSSGGSGSSKNSTQTNIINPDGTRGIGYIIDGVTYKDPYGYTRIDAGTIVQTSNGQLYQYLGNGKSEAYTPSTTVERTTYVGGQSSPTTQIFDAFIINGTTYLSGDLSRPIENDIVYTNNGIYQVKNGKGERIGNSKPSDKLSMDSGVSNPNPTLPISLSNGSAYNGFIRPVTGKDAGYIGDSGLDIATPMGTEVYAVANGKIIYSQEGKTTWARKNEDGSWRDTPYSVLIELDEPTLYNGKIVKYVYYTHLSKLIFDKLDGKGADIRVKQGELIGYSGTANDSPHLHIGLFTHRQIDKNDKSYFLKMAEVRDFFASSYGTKWEAGE